LPDQLFFDIVKMVVALAFIVGLIYAIVYVLKRLLPGAMRSGGERVEMQVLSQLNVGSRQRIAVIRVQDRTLVVGITEGSINTLADLTPELAPGLSPQEAAARKEADEPKIFSNLLSPRRDGQADQRGGVSGSEPGRGRRQPAERENGLVFRPLGPRTAQPAASPADDRGDGPLLFAPGERPPR
jgi:flagellar biosynthetic protein FliO